ncbi:MAG: glycoside hydrolase family 15 protein [Alphaproteobacteria bacterium]|nr:glycoside hydrolase family 15 protein [Alphaproteobacteria bacterium]
MMALIEDYAMIGDCRTAAIIGRDGSIDWFCAPRFDSPACFAALLGTPHNGRWLIAAQGKYSASRAYIDESLILETIISTSTGKVKLTEFMPPGTPESSIVRLVEGLEGHVDMHTEIAIRFDYGMSIPWVTRHDRRTLTAVSGPNLVTIRTPIILHGEDMHTVGKFTVRKGEAVPFVLTYGESFKAPPLSIDAFIAQDETAIFWRKWARQCRVSGRWRKIVMPSLVALKGLSYAPTGGIVAAATCSLPEQIGSTRNWDYRYCWLRDATFTLLALLNAGFTEEANVWQNWLLRVIAGAPEQLQTMYSVLGDRRLDEMTLDHLNGYEGSRPVRIGNAAVTQLQLDIYGELADVVAQAAKGGLPPAPRRTELREVILKHLESKWCEPDEGIWEIRGQSQHFVHSKVMTWVAFDRASRAPGTTAHQRRHWRSVARRIHKDICKKGVDSSGRYFVQHYGTDELDAAVLLLPLVGFLPPTDRRIKATVREIEKRLIHKGLVKRYETHSGVDGLPPGEGAFLACSFWLVDNYTLMGRRKDAMRLFNRLRRLSNDVGLYAEEYDPVAKRMLGNFPQAFSHVALINCALNLMVDAQERAQKTRKRPAGKTVSKKAKKKSSAKKAGRVTNRASKTKPRASSRQAKRKSHAG